MKAKFTNLFWGLILVLAGIYFLAENFGYIEIKSEQTWMIIFGALSVLFFASYFINGIQNWGWLFPACILGGLSATMALVLAHAEGTYMGALILFSVAIPFWVAYFLNRRENWWATIPAWSITAVGLTVFLADQVPGEVIGTIVLLATAIPFLVVYLTDRSRWWALIPAGVIGGVSLIPLLTLLGDEEWVASLVLFFIAAAFLVVYFLSRKSWWALIPAGVLLTVGIVTTLAIVSDAAEENAGLMNGIFFIGVGVTFAVLWLLRKEHKTDWAKYPAIVLGIIGLISALVADYWPLLIILLGIYILYLAVKPKKKVE